MTKIQDLKGLTEVTAALYTAAEARVAQLRRRDAELQTLLTKLEDAIVARRNGASITDVTLRAGIDFKWEQWVEGRKVQIAQEQARLRAQIENERTRLALNFGRDQAAQKLLSNARKELARTLAKKRP